MKFIIKLLLFLLAAILAGLLTAQPAIAEAPQSNSEDYISSDIIIKDNAIIKQPTPNSVPLVVDHLRKQPASGRHSTRAERTISEEQLEMYLSRSPLAAYSRQILQSPYWSTIIGICTLEQNNCTSAPYWNYWGIKARGECGSSSGGFARYCTAEESITAINNFLSKAESKGKETIESFRGWYCYDANRPDHTCPNWEPTVLRIKQVVEAL